MGTSRGQFIKYPRTPHLFGSLGTDDDKHMGEAESLRFIADPSLIVEEKLDGTNVGLPSEIPASGDPGPVARQLRLLAAGSDGFVWGESC